MKNILLVLSVFFFISCNSKDDVTPQDQGLISFNIDGQLSAAVIENNEIRLKLGNIPTWSQLKINFETSSTSELYYNGSLLESGDSIDFTKDVILELRSSVIDNKTYTVKLSSVILEYGLGFLLDKGKSLTRNYEFYEDQYGSGLSQYENCGPAVATMALKWSDSTFSRTVSDARKAYRPDGGWWYTYDISMYLSEYDVNTSYTRLSQTFTIDEYATRLMNVIDKEHLAILCLDMHPILYNANGSERTNKFYITSNDGWGHFVLVKGYRVVDGKVWFEVYDPYSIAAKNGDGTLKGKDRYYAAEELKKATDVWWEYMIVVAPQGQYVDNELRNSRTVITHQRGGGAFSLK